MLLVFAAVLVLAQAEAPAKKPARDPLLRRGAALFDTLDFENARAAYERALSVRLGSSDEVVEAYLGVGLCESTLGNEPQAKAAFLKALAIKPDAQLEGADISPRQRAPFDAARGEARGRPGIRVDHSPPVAWMPGAPLKVVVEVANDWQQLVAGARVLFRREGQSVFEEIPSSGPPPYSMLVPPLGEGGLQYYVQAIDAHGSPLAQWRSAEAPHSLKLSPSAVAESAPLYQKPWLWVIVGGVVAAGITTAVLAGTLQQPDYQVKTRPPP
jgi:tetratricopeptide (TPR) repeat protein